MLSGPGVWLRVVLALGFIAAWSPGKFAHADNEPTAAEKKHAKKLVVQANKLKKMGDKLVKKKRKAKAMVRYRKAALNLIEAYNLQEHPYFLFKLAEVYRARGDKTWALRGYLTYLDKDPDGLGAERATGYIEELRAAIALDKDKGIEEELDDELDPSAIFLEATEPKVEEPEAEPGDDDAGDDDDDGDKEPPEKIEGPKRTPEPGKWMKWSGIGSAAAGVILFSLGIKFGMDAGSAADTLSKNDDGWTPADRALIDAGKSDETKAIVFSVIGVAAIAGGGALYYLGRNKAMASRKSVEVTLVPSPTGAALSLSGRF